MRRRTLLLAACVAFIGAGALLAAMARLDETPLPPPPPQTPPKALPLLAADLRVADRIEIRHGQSVLWLERRGQVWGLSQAGGYPVRPSEAAALVDGLLALTLDHPVAETPDGAGVADPSASTNAGTLVRVLAASDAVLGAIILGPGSGPAYVRRPGQQVVWLAEPHIQASTDPDDWLDHQIAPPDMDHMTIVAGDGPGYGPGNAQDAAMLRRALTALSFTEVRSSPQIHAAPLGSVQLVLSDGTASLALGRLDGRDWLQVTGTSGWARRLSPYAFALPGKGPLGGIR